MSSVVKHVRVGRRRVAVAVATMAMGGATVIAPGAAQADPALPAPLAGSRTDRAVDRAVVPHHKIPREAVPSNGELPREGSYGPAFGRQTSDNGPVSPKIVNGTPANAADYPWIVGIKNYFLAEDQNGDLGWWVATCTGTVISRTKVLTAAHCIVGAAAGATSVILGRSNLADESSGYVARVSSTWTHQSFNYAALDRGTTDVPVDDVSVLTLKQPLPDAYTPIALTEQGDQAPYAAGTGALIIGYGVTGSGASDSGILREATVQMQSNATCQSNLGSRYDQNRMICAGDLATGKDTCGGDSGGPIVVDGVQAGITDWGYRPCGSRYGVYERLSYYANQIKTDLTRPPLINLDWSGDGISDLLARERDGWLVEWSGSGLGSDGYGGFAGGRYLGRGWNAYSKLFRVTNWNGDHTPSIFGVTPAGALYQYKNDGRGEFASSALLIGTGWQNFTDIMVTNNWTGDGRPNLMGRRSNGDLILYTSNGAGGWLNPKGTLIGTGWNSFDIVLTPGAWEGDGYQTLIGRRTNGDLVLYKSDGAGGWTNPKGTLIGTGWGSFKVFMSPGDWNGDNLIDLIGITPAGAVRLYTTNGYGKWLDGRGTQIDSGWNAYDLVF